MRVLITGAAGFIGAHLARRLVERGCEVLGYDDVNPYYDPRPERDRLAAPRKAELRMAPMQAGDVQDTYADVEALRRDTGYAPATSVETGVARFAEWARSYYGA